MKSKILIPLLLLAAKTTFCQNTFPWRQNGNIGIGTDNPSATLDVRGNTIFGVDGSDAFVSLRGFNGSLTKIQNNSGYSTNYNGLAITSNSNNIGNLPSWTLDLGGIDRFSYNNFDTYSIRRNNIEQFRITSSGNIGIGTTSPNQRLTINGGGIGFDWNSADKKLYSPNDGDLEWMTHNGAGVHGFAVSHQGDKKVYLNTSGASYFVGGNLGIGTTTPDALLAVNGAIHTQSVRVDMTGWSDYVFKPKYILRPLNEIQAYINTNGHLPDLPSKRR